MMMKKSILLLLLLLIIISNSFSQNVQSEYNFSELNISIEFPEIIVKDVEQEIKIQIIDADFATKLEGELIQVQLNNQIYEGEVVDGLLLINYKFPNKESLFIEIRNFNLQLDVNPIPLWLSIIPPLIAILFALVFREVYTALFAGVWSGTFIIYFFQGSGIFSAVFKGFLAIVDTYVIESLSDSGHLSIILFSMVIAATVSLITKNGGMKGVVNRLSKYATGPRSGAFITWMLGVLIFFDDYANTLVVGNAMRPLTDKLRISREKLAYIIDSTAAPVASIAFVTTWIGAELSYIQDGINELNLDESAYGVFFNSLTYSFYPFFTLAFIVMLIWKGTDFGPMLKAEGKARQKTQVNSDPIEALNEDQLREISVASNVKPRSFNAVIPVLVIIFGTLSALIYTGWSQAVWDDPALGFFGKLSETIGKADSYIALLWASLGSLFVAIVLTLSQRLLSLSQSIDSLVGGFKTMLPAVMILTLAWSVALITEHLHTADFISQLLLEASVSPYLIPTLTFIMAALVSFSTGSSWGTMAILYPLILPAAWMVAESSGLDYDASLAIFHNVAAAVLTGSVLGDHCSPISDTTILSSLASSCPHIEHVRTQLPYALTTGFFAIALGTLPAAYGISSWILFPAGLIGLYLIIHFFGKKPEQYFVQSS